MPEAAATRMDDRSRRRVVALKWRLLMLANADPELSATGTAALLALLDCHNTETGACFPSLDVVAHKMGRSRRQATAGVGHVVARGYVRQIRTRGVPSYEFAFELVDTPRIVGGTEHVDAREAAHQKGPEDARKAAHQVPDDTRKAARLAARKAAHITLEYNLPPYSPPTRRAAEAPKRAFRKQTEFVATSSPLWPWCAAHWRSEHSKRSGPPPTASAEHSNEAGWYFSADVIAAARRATASDQAEGAG